MDLRRPAKRSGFKVVARIRMTCASGSRLVSPRAGAHIWGKGARILTEINRLPHFGAKFPPNLAPLAGNPVYLTREGGELMQMGARAGAEGLARGGSGRPDGNESLWQKWIHPRFVRAARGWAGRPGLGWAGEGGQAA
jgi:hypothetical protein